MPVLGLLMPPRPPQAAFNYMHLHQRIASLFCALLQGGFQYYLYNGFFSAICRPITNVVGHLGVAPVKVFIDQCIHHPLLYFPSFYTMKVGWRQPYCCGPGCLGAVWSGGDALLLWLRMPWGCVEWAAGWWCRPGVCVFEAQKSRVCVCGNVCAFAYVCLCVHAHMCACACMCVRVHVFILRVWQWRMPWSCP